MDSEYVSTRKKKTFTSIASTLFKYYCLSKKKKATKKKKPKNKATRSHTIFFLRVRMILMECLPLRKSTATNPTPHLTHNHVTLHASWFG